MRRCGFRINISGAGAAAGFGALLARRAVIFRIAAFAYTAV